MNKQTLIREGVVQGLMPVGKLIAGADPGIKKVVLFGGYAWGTAKPLSDFDIAVIIEDKEYEYYDIYGPLYEEKRVEQVVVRKLQRHGVPVRRDENDFRAGRIEVEVFSHSDEKRIKEFPRGVEADVFLRGKTLWSKEK